MYGWGNGANYQLGSGAVGLQEQPVRLDSLHGISVKIVAAAKFHSAAITQKGQLFTWGFGRGGRLGKALSMQAISAHSLFLLHSCSELAYIRTLPAACVVPTVCRFSANCRFYLSAFCPQALPHTYGTDTAKCQAINIHIVRSVYMQGTVSFTFTVGRAQSFCRSRWPSSARGRSSK